MARASSDRPLSLPTGSTVGRDGQEANARLINGYAEPQGEDGKAPFVIYADPGLTRFSVSSYILPSRGLITRDDATLIGVMGNQVVSFDVDGVSSALATVAGSDHLTMALNQNVSPQIGMVGDGGTYYLLSGSTVTTPTTGFGAPDSICYLKGKFVLTEASGRFFHSAIDDGSTFNALSYDYANSDPDGIVRAVAHMGYLYIFGRKSVELWQDAGTTPFAFAPMQQYIAHGLLAKHSIAENDKGLLWIDHRGIVRWGRDASAQRVSTHTIERAIEELSDDDRAAIRGSYSTSQGHEWYTLSCPQWTWVLDLSTQKWHQRRSYGDVRWIGDQAVWFNGHWIVADYRNGLLYTLNADDYTEDGAEFTLELWCKHTHAFPNAFMADQLNLDVISGAGLEGGAIEDTDPQITVDVSDDGGKTFKAERRAPIGRQGDFGRLVSLNQWGRVAQKGRIWRIRGTSRTLRGVVQASIQTRSAF